MKKRSVFSSEALDDAVRLSDFLAEVAENILKRNGIKAVLMKAERTDGDEAFFKEKFDEYMKYYPRLHQPALQDMLEQMIRLYVDIKRIRDYIRDSKIGIDNRKEYISMMKLLLEIIGKWNLIMTRMALTFTAQPYVPVDERKVELPKDLARLDKQMDKLKMKVEKQVKTAKKKRAHPGGARKIEHGLPITWGEKKRKKTKNTSTQ